MPWNEFIMNKKKCHTLFCKSFHKGQKISEGKCGVSHKNKNQSFLWIKANHYHINWWVSNTKKCLYFSISTTLWRIGQKLGKCSFWFGENWGHQNFLSRFLNLYQDPHFLSNHTLSMYYHGIANAGPARQRPPAQHDQLLHARPPLVGLPTGQPRQDGSLQRLPHTGQAHCHCTVIPKG